MRQTPVVITVTAPVPLDYPVGTVVEITIGWLSPSAAGTGYLNIDITAADGTVTAIPVGVLAPEATDTVSYTCHAAGVTEVRVKEATGHRWEDLGSFYLFRVA